MQTSELDPEILKEDLLWYKAAGSIGQIVPVLLLPHLSQATDSPYLKSIFEAWSVYGILDFPLYVAKDMFLSYEGGKVQGDWLEFSKASGVSLITLFGASIVWSAALLAYHKRHKPSFTSDARESGVTLCSMSLAL